MLLVVYNGDETVAAQFPHGNCNTNRDYVRTQPHVLQQVRNTAANSSKNIYRSMVSSAAHVSQATPVTAAPRNVEQVRNAKKALKNKARLSRDALYNLHEFAYDSQFVHRIVTFPDLSVTCYNPTIVDMFNGLLAFTSDCDKPTIILTYDTTFNLGDFYVSVLLFRHTDFDPSPIVPLAYLIHERKLQSTHDEFFQHIRTLCPQLDRAVNAVVITDSEAAITSSIKNNFPSLHTFLCWNHVIQVLINRSTTLCNNISTGWLKKSKLLHSTTSSVFLSHHVFCVV